MPIFLVEVNASVYDNDINYLVRACNEEECRKAVELHLKLHARALIGSELEITKLPDRLGIIYNYCPHAGDPNLGL